MAKRPVPRYDFKAFGAAIKAAREGCKESRKKVGDEMFISPRYLANIENKGQHPSLQILPKFADILINSISYALPLMRRSVAKQALNVILRGTRTNAIFGVGTA